MSQVSLESYDQDDQPPSGQEDSWTAGVAQAIYGKPGQNPESNASAAKKIGTSESAAGSNSTAQTEHPGTGNVKNGGPGADVSAMQNRPEMKAQAGRQPGQYLDIPEAFPGLLTPPTEQEQAALAKAKAIEQAREEAVSIKPADGQWHDYQYQNPDGSMTTGRVLKDKKDGSRIIYEDREDGGYEIRTRPAGQIKNGDEITVVSKEEAAKIAAARAESKLEEEELSKIASDGEWHDYSYQKPDGSTSTGRILKHSDGSRIKIAEEAEEKDGKLSVWVHQSGDIKNTYVGKIGKDAKIEFEADTNHKVVKIEGKEHSFRPDHLIVIDFENGNIIEGQQSTAYASSRSEGEPRSYFVTMKGKSFNQSVELQFADVGDVEMSGRGFKIEYLDSTFGSRWDNTAYINSFGVLHILDPDFDGPQTFLADKYDSRGNDITAVLPHIGLFTSQDNRSRGIPLKPSPNGSNPKDWPRIESGRYAGDFYPFKVRE